MSEITNKFGFRTSAEIGEIAAALVAAQAKFGAAVKDSANPYYRSKYADLSAVIEATQKPLNEQGIAVLQAPQLEGQMVTITTRLQHKSGQWYESDLTLPAMQGERFDAQSVGSAITYGRRYSLQAITGLATEDDDGNAASGVGSKQAAQEVGKKKVREAQTALFYTMPPNHNGHFAEFVNIPGYLGAHPDQEEQLRLAFSARKAKRTKDDTTLVPAEHLQNLLDYLAGDMGVSVKELKGSAN